MGVEYPVVLLANKVDPPRNITPQLSRETSKDSSTGTGTSVSSGEGSVVSEGGSKKVRRCGLHSFSPDPVGFSMFPHHP